MYKHKYRRLLTTLVTGPIHRSEVALPPSTGTWADDCNRIHYISLPKSIRFIWDAALTSFIETKIFTHKLRSSFVSMAFGLMTTFIMYPYHYISEISYFFVNTLKAPYNSVVNDKRHFSKPTNFILDKLDYFENPLYHVAITYATLVLLTS